MSYEVNLSPKAVNDIDEIFQYISGELGEEQVAVNVITSLEKFIYSLDEMPYRYRVYENEPWKSIGVRVACVKKYLVFYIVNEDIKTVDVFRIIYGSRNLDNALNT